MGFSEILIAPCMAASSPFPPSPLRAGPKHSGRRMSSLTTTLAFSSTLSPEEERGLVSFALESTTSKLFVAGELGEQHFICFVTYQYYEEISMKER